MLAIMTGQAAPDRLFGVELRSQILRAHLQAVRASRRAFASSQPDAVAEMLRIVARACQVAQSGKCHVVAEGGSGPEPRSADLCAESVRTRSAEPPPSGCANPVK